MFNIDKNTLRPFDINFDYQNNMYWLKNIQDSSSFEEVITFIKYQNQNDPNNFKFDLRSIASPVGVKGPIEDLYNPNGRAGFNLYKIDCGWLLEREDGVNIGYIHLNWEFGIPLNPSADPNFLINVDLSEILLRNDMRKKGLSLKMISETVKHINQQLDLIITLNPRLRSLHWKLFFNADIQSKEGSSAFNYLKTSVIECVKTYKNENSIFESNLTM